MLTVRQHWVCITLKMRTPQNYVKNADTTEAYFNKSHLLRRVRFNKLLSTAHCMIVIISLGVFSIFFWLTDVLKCSPYKYTTISISTLVLLSNNAQTLHKPPSTIMFINYWENCENRYCSAFPQAM